MSLGSEFSHEVVARIIVYPLRPWSLGLMRLEDLACDNSSKRTSAGSGDGCSRVLRPNVCDCGTARSRAIGRGH